MTEEKTKFERNLEEIRSFKKKQSNKRWDEYFLVMAIHVSMKSKDSSTKCGCVLVGPNHEVRSTGYNGFPRGVDDQVTTKPDRHQRPAKYLWYEHAERNAVYCAARHGTPTDGCIAYVNAPPCADCCRALIQCGVVRVVVPKWHNMRDKETSERWQEHTEVAKQMYREAGVSFTEHEISDTHEIGREFYNYLNANFSEEKGAWLA